MKTYDKISNMIYKLRDMGEFPELNSGEGKDWQDKQTPFVYELLTLRRLANKHHKLAEMDCNGEGVIRGQHYYNGTIDDYAKRTYGYGVKSAYLTDGDTTVFDIESDKVQDKIWAITKRLGLRVEFQGDPRGYTVKFFKGDRFLDIQG